MNKLIIKFFLNTPRKYWVVVSGYHFHKAFWGCLLILIGVVFLWAKRSWIGWALLIIGILMVGLSVAGNIYTHDRPYFRLWDRQK